MKHYSSAYYHRTADAGKAVRIAIGWLAEYRSLFYKYFLLAVVFEMVAMGARVLFANILTAVESADSYGLAVWLLVIIGYDALHLTIDVMLVRTVVRNIGYRLWRRLTMKIIGHVSTLGLDFFTSMPAAVIWDRLEKVANVADLAEQAAFTVVTHSLQVIVSIVMLASFFPGSVPLVALSMCGFMISTVAMYKRQTPSRRRQRDIDEKFIAESRSRLVYTNTTLVSNSALERTLRSLDQGFGKLERVGMLSLSFALTGSGILRDVMLYMGRRAVLAASILMLLAGVLTIPEVVLVHTIVETMFIGMWGVARFLFNFTHESESIIKLDELLQLKPAIVEPAEPVAIPDGPLSYSLKGVGYRYPEHGWQLTADEKNADEDLSDPDRKKGIALRERLGLGAVRQRKLDEGQLRDISFEIRPGEIVALVGRSGAGKTTAASLLAGLRHPTQGELKVCGIPIQDVSQQALLARVAIVPQGTAIDLYNDTLWFNLTLGAPYSVDEVVSALKAAALWDTIVEEFPALLYERIGERGRTLSGGQQQRVAIARAILQNPDLLILDEATSALDTETEVLVQQALDNLLRGRTAVVIAHRLSTIRHADKIVVLDGGKVQAVGKWHELLDKCLPFRNLVKLQNIA